MKVKITVASCAAGGKTTVSKIIEEALRNAGFNVTNSDPDKDYQIDFERAKQSLTKNAEIEIDTLQLSRMRFGEE